jgi:inorganic pyrophosphatase/exopolyphosphatase
MMVRMEIVTSGKRYIDIDAYGGCVAYAELLRLQGREAQAVSEAAWNESISRSVRSWNAPFETTYEPSADDTFAVIDVSDPDHFAGYVDPEKVVAVIDHHPGFEEYWQQRIGSEARIEFIGAACTQVYEQWQAAGLADKMSAVSARLLIAGILDNTLNFGAQVTTGRDKAAYAALLPLSGLPDNWAEQYFTECQEGILADVHAATVSDSKVLAFASLPGVVGVGQLAVWNAEDMLAHHKDDIEAALAAVHPEWFMNLIHIGEGRSYFISEDARIRSWLAGLLEITFDGPLAKADRLWLRKEILKADIEAGR